CIPAAISRAADADSPSGTAVVVGAVGVLHAALSIGACSTRTRAAAVDAGLALVRFFVVTRVRARVRRVRRAEQRGRAIAVDAAALTGCALRRAWPAAVHVGLARILHAIRAVVAVRVEDAADARDPAVAVTDEAEACAREPIEVGAVALLG